MNWPAQGAAALFIGLGWWSAMLLIVTALTRAEKKHVRPDQDEH